MTTRIHEVIAVFPLDGKGSDIEISPEQQALYDAELAQAAALDALVIKSQWAAAACEIAAAACNHDDFPLFGFQHKFWPADEESDDYANARIMWRHEGRIYRMDLSYNVITGHGSVDLDIDQESVMFVQVLMCGWDKPPRMDGSRPPEDLASPDGTIYGKVTGGSEYVPGSWEAVLTDVAEQLRQVKTS
ncbi:hypothetical protein FFK22_037100 [Mycobacterium sp. KBS0706]|uniref:hypothetical protein n=1 Tax=Mycobacterium sp. KBS0706 TaxID=2578109 RepID=UPI00110F961F|nr:hypothetical protein [Mycobacterium sp. KBS0706]TSD83570.1 hypothetical protein FFK22_037100 [Mycobacterium sp. KBS0706]